MTGGVLQLVARGTEDIYITSNPNITFFKTVYRRHTNFSRQELDLNFTNKMDFGKEGYCRIEHYGDLLHRLYLVVKLPKVDIVFRSLTVGEVQALLKTYDIIWITNQDPSSKFNEADYLVVEKLIIQKLETLNNELGIFNDILFELGPRGPFWPETWKRNHPTFSDNIDSNNNGVTDAGDEYYDDILVDPQDGFFKYDTYNLQYKIIDSNSKDIVKSGMILPLANSFEIQKIMLN
jgi:hypothetical protein